MTRYLKYSNYDPITGESTATIVTEYGEFTATAKTHPEDRAIASAYFGCFLAELRANIKYFKARKRNFKAQLKGLTDFHKTLKSYAKYDEKDFTVCRLIKQIQERQRLIDECDNAIWHLKDTCTREEVRRRALITKIRDKGQN